MRRSPGRNPTALISGTQGLSQQTAGTVVKVALDTVVRDNMSWWDATNKRYQVQQQGLYVVTVSFAASVALLDQLLADVCVAVNGTALANAFSRWVASGNSYGPLGGASGLINLLVGDYVEFHGGTNRSGGAAGTGYLGVMFAEAVA